MNILVISNPNLYPDLSYDIPNFYLRLAQNKEIDLFHLDSEQVMLKDHESEHILAAQIPRYFTFQDFRELPRQPSKLLSLRQFDLVFCRTLKPFPTGYLTRLSFWENFTKFVNSPSHKQEQITADFLLKVAKQWIPEAIVTDDPKEAYEFLQRHQTIVSKQVNSCGGRGVFKIWQEQNLFKVDNFQTGSHTFKHFSEALNHAKGSTNEPLQLVRYLSQVNQGDKRVVVVDGEIYGAYLRRSQTGHWVNNVSGDGQCILAEVGDHEREAIADTVKAYQKLGLHTLGYDFLQDDDDRWCISEINAGNIGGFFRLQQLTHTPVMDRLIDWLISYAKSDLSVDHGYSETTLRSTKIA